MQTPDQKKWANYFFRGLPLNEELGAMMDELVEEFYIPETSCFNYSDCKNSKAYSQLQVLARSMNNFDPLTIEGHEERKAFWINLYNALVMHLVIVEDVGQTILEVKEFFTSYHYQLKGLSVTLDHIEHGILRGNRPNFLRFIRPFRSGNPALQHVLEPDPRIHMALFCASMSCAALKAYHPHNIDQELDIAVCNTLGKLVYIENKKIFLPKCFYWYSKDFGGKKGSLEFVIQHHPDPEIAQFIRENKKKLSIGWQTFDWRLNKI